MSELPAQNYKIEFILLLLLLLLALLLLLLLLISKVPIVSCYTEIRVQQLYPYELGIYASYVHLFLWCSLLFYIFQIYFIICLSTILSMQNKVVAMFTGLLFLRLPLFADSVAKEPCLLECHMKPCRTVLLSSGHI